MEIATAVVLIDEWRNRADGDGDTEEKIGADSEWQMKDVPVFMERPLVPEEGAVSLDPSGVLIAFDRSEMPNKAG